MRSRNLKASRQETPTESLRKKAGAEDEHVLEMQIADVSRDGQSTSGLRVVTEEVVRGAGAVEFRKNDPNAMHRGHDLWLSSLKHVSEKEQTPLPKKISAESGTAHKERLSQSPGEMKPKLLILEKDEGEHRVRRPRELPMT
jgi:hypothetical protein